MKVPKPIRIWFSDMWPNFDFEHNYFTWHLKQNFNIEINRKPDFLIHSIYTKNYLNYDCYRICCTGENTRPDFTKSDFQIGFDYIDNPFYLRWPLFLMNKNVPELLLKVKDIDSIIRQKKRFCSFVVSNDQAKERIDLFKNLSAYKRVDSGGKYLNNIGSPVADKLEFLKESKFNIAYENSSYPGYSTEKIFEAFLTYNIPVYWGNFVINKDFNEKAFINTHNFKTIQDLVEFIKYIDEDESAYRSMLKESCFVNNEIPVQFQVSHFIEFFDYIFGQAGRKKPVSKFTNRIEFISDRINYASNRIQYFSGKVRSRIFS
jgi:hypothetical protein